MNRLFADPEGRWAAAAVAPSIKQTFINQINSTIKQGKRGGQHRERGGATTIEANPGILACASKKVRNVENNFKRMACMYALNREMIQLQSTSFEIRHQPDLTNVPSLQRFEEIGIERNLGNGGGI